MKTTIEIAAPLLRRAKRFAARRGTTLRGVVEEALRVALDADEKRARSAPIQTRTFGGRGLQSGLSWGDWSGLRALAYEGHGG